jgi:DNA-binding NarL/FixJ family response regulator
MICAALLIIHKWLYRTEHNDEASMHIRSIVRVLVVDDFEPFRRAIRSTLLTAPEFQIICEVSDGLDAVRKAKELQPDLILLDVGLPKLNGIEAARQIRKLSPESKILFVSQESSAAFAQEALDTGARGYVVKSDAGRDLVPAVQAILRGGVFVSLSLAGKVVINTTSEQPHDHPRQKDVVVPFPPHEISRRHEIAFYPDDAFRVDGYKRFIEDALKIGSAVIVITTESCRATLSQKLRADGVDVGTAIQQGIYISLDVADMLATFIVDDLPDPVRFMNAAGDLITRAAGATKGKRRRVTACGELAPTLLAAGKAEAAVYLEHLWDEIARRYDIEILCAYLSDDFQDKDRFHIIKRICAEHSTVRAYRRG